MPINFIPNDPRAGATAPVMTVKAARANRPASKSGFIFSGTSPQAVAAPGTPQFLFWQCREGAIAALEAWEASAGPHKRWQGNRRKIQLLQDAGEDLNAFYDRASLSFFHMAIGGTTFFSGASTDVVAHEAGHALLDSIRPDFFEVNFLEVGAFHEAFGDCLAVLTALGDQDTRQKLLAVTATLRARNFVESTAEDLSAGIKLLQATHNASEPRHAFNTFQFRIPTTLPTTGGPGALINEVHSFGMIFTGCFWDLIANIFSAGATKTEADLLAAARLAGKILIAGAKNAVVTPRFLQSVGRAMVLADQSLHGGANREHIGKAFLAHDIQLGSSAMLAPTMALAGKAPKGATLTAATRQDLARRLGGVRGAKLNIASSNLFGTRVVSAVRTRDVPLGNVDKRLKGVVAAATEPVMVGSSGGVAAVLGALPNTEDTESEVQSFVKSLLDHGRIAFQKPKTSAVALTSLAAKKKQVEYATHVITTERGKKVLKRIRFRCTPCCWGHEIGG